MKPRRISPTGPGSLRVLFVIPGAARGSSMIFARRQAGSLRRAGVAVSLFHLRSRTSCWSLAQEWLRFRRRLRRLDPAVIHAQFGTVTALFAALAGGGRPLVITYRGGDLNPPSRTAPLAERIRAWIGHAFSQAAALPASHIVCVSHGLQRQLWWRRARSVVLPTGVDTRLFFPRSRTAARQRLRWTDVERVILFNAGCDPRIKRLDLARAAADLAGAALPHVRLEVLDGRIPPACVPWLMNAADCLLLTSDSEGSPAVVQEALACDLPVVSVDVGDVAERLNGVARSHLVERDPRAIALALIDVLSGPGRSNGSSRTGMFATHRLAGQLRRIYWEAGSDARGDAGPEAGTVPAAPRARIDGGRERGL